MFWTEIFLHPEANRFNHGQKGRTSLTRAQYLNILNDLGKHPSLLTDQGRTRGVPHQSQFLHNSPSDRIGSNLTPTAKHLKLQALKEDRIRRARLKQLIKQEALMAKKYQMKDEKPVSSYKPKPYVKYNKLVSRPPRRPRYVE